MTESKELRFPYTDMTVLAVSCQHCGAETTVDLANQQQQQSIKNSIASQSQNDRLACGVCRRQFDSALGEALAEFIRWLQAMKRADLAASFRVVLLKTGETAK